MIAPARTGRASRSKIAVIRIDQGKRHIRSIENPDVRVFLIVLIKFTAPNREEIPARWIEKIARSTEGPEWPRLALRGG